MCEVNNADDIPSAEQLQLMKKEELSKLHKLEIILALTKNANTNSMDIIDVKNLEKCLASLAVQNYLKFDDNCVLLGLDEDKDFLLTYTERKAIRQYLVENLPRKYQPIIDRMKTFREESPLIFELDKMHLEILELEEKRRQLHLELVDNKNKTFELLKVCAQLKLGPYLKNDIDVLYSGYKLNHIKSITFQKFLLHKFFSQTEHTVKAVKEVKKYVDQQYDEQIAPN